MNLVVMGFRSDMTLHFKACIDLEPPKTKASMEKGPAFIANVVAARPRHKDVYLFTMAASPVDSDDPYFEENVAHKSEGTYEANLGRLDAVIKCAYDFNSKLSKSFKDHIGENDMIITCFVHSDEFESWIAMAKRILVPLLKRGGSKVLLSCPHGSHRCIAGGRVVT